jgi:hypothetical protein
MGSDSNLTKPLVLRWKHPACLRFAVDKTQNRGDPINREHDLPTFFFNGERHIDQKEMRAGKIMTAKRHIESLSVLYPDEKVEAFVGNGNLLANFDFVAVHNGELYYLADEPIFKKKYTAIVMWKNGQSTVEQVWLATENGKTIVTRKKDSTVEDITERIVFLTSGQPLIHHGGIVPLAQFAEKWYDTRHLVQPLRYGMFGEETLATVR